MLAASAIKAGLKPVVIDRFADHDTRQLCTWVYQVNSLALPDLAPVLIQCKSIFPLASVVYGSGFEQYPESLVYLCQNFQILGNDPDSFKKTIDKPYFFSRLKHWEIPFPQVDFEGDQGKPGLIKPLAGEGGQGICSEQRLLKVGEYWQEKVFGVPMSVSFICRQGQVDVIGFNRQWTERDSFLFSGIMTCKDLPESETACIGSWLLKMAAGFSLQGLNSLDFIWDGQRSYVLELNARPGASLALYDDYLSGGLLAQHIKCCLGRQIDTMKEVSWVRAYQILFADCDLFITKRILWPEWAADRPESGARIRCRQALCSIMAQAETAAQIEQQLADRKQILFNLVKEFQSCYTKTVSIN